MEFAEVYRRLVETWETVTDRSEFRQAACEEIADVLEWTVWIGTADARAGSLEVHASAHPDCSPLPQTTVAIEPESFGPTTQVANSGTVQVVSEIDRNPEYRHLRENLRETYRSSVSVPLETDDVLHLYATETIEEGNHDDFATIGTLLTQGLRSFQTSETLSHQRRRLEHIRSTVSHDLRNPLNIGQGRLEIVRSECDHPDLDHVDYGFDRMEQLVEEIVTFTRVSEPVETTTSLSLKAVSRECWNSIEAEPESLTVTGDRTIHADPERIRTLFEELFLNAVEHGEGDAGLTVRVGPLPEESGFFVEDTGPGIPDDDREYVFDWGYSTAGGNGHGLALVDEVAKAHGWDIWLADGRCEGLKVGIQMT